MLLIFDSLSYKQSKNQHDPNDDDDYDDDDDDDDDKEFRNPTAHMKRHKKPKVILKGRKKS